MSPASRSKQKKAEVERREVEERGKNYIKYSPIGKGYNNHRIAEILRGENRGRWTIVNDKTNKPLLDYEGNPILTKKRKGAVKDYTNYYNFDKYRAVRDRGGEGWKVTDGAGSDVYDNNSNVIRGKTRKEVGKKFHENYRIKLRKGRKIRLPRTYQGNGPLRETGNRWVTFGKNIWKGKILKAVLKLDPKTVKSILTPLKQAEEGKIERVI